MEAPASTPDWNDDKNARRFALIDKDTDGSITDEEGKELAELTSGLDLHLQNLALNPNMKGVEALLRGLLLKGDTSDV